jgi:putative ubiquitin-RnfH superfamily antitoxin RatB of RatAB toxin-antitoxin module
MADAECLPIEVVYACREVQAVAALEVPPGTTVGEALRLSGLLERFPEIDPVRSALGVFGVRVSPGDAVRAGDRIEVYRPLALDPKEARRRRARAGRRTVG